MTTDARREIVMVRTPSGTGWAVWRIGESITEAANEQFVGALYRTANEKGWYWRDQPGLRFATRTDAIDARLGHAG